MDKKSSQSCPSCGTRLDLNAESLADGLCPRCLLESSLHSTIAGQAKASPPPSVEVVSAAFADLEIIELIGRGGMGAVYKARQKSLDRLVALKLLPISLAADLEFAKRFEAEAKALATLNHPNIVTVHDFGQQGDFYYLLMEYVDGPNLRNLLQDHRMTPDEALTIIPRVCDALEFAHKRNIVHCDIKPENLLLNTDGQVKIADFGIARILGQSNADTESEKTAGTPAYMAPEQMDSPHAIDTRADIYSLGVVFYEMLTGERPGKDFSPPSGKNTSVDIRLDKIVQRALAANPNLRWQSANALNSELQTILTENLGEPKVTPPEKLPNSTLTRGWIAGALAIAVVVTFVLSFIAQSHYTPVPESEHQAAIDRYLEVQLDRVDKRAKEDALQEKPKLTRAEKEAKRELEHQESFRFLHLFGELKGVNGPALGSRYHYLSLLLYLVLGTVAFVFGYRHLSWLRGQKEPLPALLGGTLGTVLCPLLLATLLILSVASRIDSFLAKAMVLICALLLSLWTVRRVLAWTRNFRNAPSFGVKLVIGVILMGFAIAIPYNAAQQSYRNATHALSTVTIDLERSHQLYIGNMHLDQHTPQSAKLEKARRLTEEYARNKQSSYLLGNKPFRLMMPKGRDLLITSIWTLLTLAVAITLILKSRKRRA